MRSIVQRYEKNPILTKRDIPYPVETVHNAAMADHDVGLGTVICYATSP